LRGLSFFVKQELYTVDVTGVMKVVRNISTTPVPAVSDEVVGIVNLKGMVITILSLPALLGYKHTGEMINVDTINAVIFKPMVDSSDQMGLLIDAPGDLISIDTDSIRPLPVNVTFEEKQILSGLADVDGKLYRIIDIASIVNRFSDSGSAAATTTTDKQQEENNDG